MFACKLLATALLFNLHMIFQSVVAAFMVEGVTCCLRAGVKIYPTKYDQSPPSDEQPQLLVSRGSWRYSLISVSVGAGFVFALKSKAEVCFILCPGVWGLCVHQGEQNLVCSLMVAFITMWKIACPHHHGALAQWPAEWFCGEAAEGAAGTSVLHHCIGD